MKSHLSPDHQPIKRIHRKSVFKKNNTLTEQKKPKPSIFRSQTEKSQLTENCKNNEISIFRKNEFSSNISNHSDIFKKTPVKVKYFDESTKNILVFLLLKIMLCSILFWLLSLLLLLIQIHVNDVCFSPDHCLCDNVFVYFYTMVRDFYSGYASLILLTYYCFNFITTSFYQQTYFRNVYLTNCLFAMFLFYGYDYENRFQSIKYIIFRRNLVIFLIINIIYVFLVTFANRRFDREFCTRLFLMGGYLFFMMFHILYMKPYFVLYSADYLKGFRSISKNFDIFKFLLIGI